MYPQEGEDLSVEAVYRLHDAPEAVRTRFKRLDEMLALEIAQGATLVQAARRANLSEKTARRRWHDPAFRERVRRLQRDLSAPAAGKIASNMVNAAATLANCLNAKSEHVRIAAVRVFLTLGQSLVDRAEPEAQVTEKIAKLESTLADLLAARVGPSGSDEPQEGQKSA